MFLPWLCTTCTCQSNMYQLNVLQPNNIKSFCKELSLVFTMNGTKKKKTTKKTMSTVIELALLLVWAQGNKMVLV